MHSLAVMRRLRTAVVLLTLAVLAGCFGEGSGQRSIPGTPPPPLLDTTDPADYELVFADEFSEGTAPDPAIWNYELGYGENGWGNNEWQLYTDSPDNVRVEDGNLVIQARCDTPPCGVRDGTVTSARITTQDKFEFRFGIVEARIQVPVGAGAWPAFWSLGANFPEIGWPRSGEIDFTEVFNTGSNGSTTHFTMHWCDETIQAPAECSFPAGRVFVSESEMLDESLGDDFHVFKAVWDANGITGFIDDIGYFELDIEPATMEEFLREFFLILNVAMGGTLGSGSQPPDGSEVFPQTMLVDYVRVYQRIDRDEFFIDFEDDPGSYSFSEFEGGPIDVVANPDQNELNMSAQVARARKFMSASGALFGGGVLALPVPVTIGEGSSFTQLVWSQRPVPVLFKLEGTAVIEDEIQHTGSGWELLTYDFSSFSGTVESLVWIFDNGTNGNADADPVNWTFYIDDVTLIPPDMVVDETPPTLTSVSIASSNMDPTIAVTGDTVTVSVVADEPIMMPTVMIGGMVADTVTGADTTWDASLALTDGTDGPIAFTVDYTDLAGNSGNTVSASTDGSTVVFDSSALSVTILGAPESFLTLDPFQVTVEFSAFIFGFGLTDIVVGNGSANGLTITGDTTYTVNITPDGMGDLTIDIPADVVMDLAGNSNVAAPTVTVLNGIGGGGVTEFAEDLEGLGMADPNALGAAGWLVFGNVFDSGGNFKFGYGPNTAPNGGSAFSAIVSGEGGASQGAQQLSVYNDYSCCMPSEGHFNGTDLVESNVFQERTIGADDLGRTWTFSFDAKKGNLSGATTAIAFFKVLDSVGGSFAQLAFPNTDMTSIPADWVRYEVSVNIDPAWDGQLLQFGFASTASNFEDSGIFYDNLEVTSVPTP